jgi:hypothetical protein
MTAVAFDPIECYTNQCTRSSTQGMPVLPPVNDASRFITRGTERYIRLQLAHYTIHLRVDADCL